MYWIKFQIIVIVIFYYEKGAIIPSANILLQTVLLCENEF